MLKGRAMCFFVEIEYENLIEFGSLCDIIGHNFENYKRRKVDSEQDRKTPHTKKKTQNVFRPVEQRPENLDKGKTPIMVYEDPILNENGETNGEKGLVQVPREKEVPAPIEEDFETDLKA